MNARQARPARHVRPEQPDQQARSEEEQRVQVDSRLRTGLCSVPFVAALVLVSLVLGAASAGAQEQRLHQITWGHPAPGEVSRFVVLISPVDGSVADARQVEVGLPAGENIGSMTIYSAMVSFTADEFLAVAAIGRNGLMSVPSDWSGMPPSRPGQPMLVEEP